jgi:hypothetical protein
MNTANDLSKKVDIELVKIKDRRNHLYNVDKVQLEDQERTLLRTYDAEGNSLVSGGKGYLQRAHIKMILKM